MSGAHLLDLQATPAPPTLTLPRLRGRVRVGWWEVDGIEPLAKKDCVYSAATAPACPYLHFPNWRKREVLIPNGARPSISLRTSAGLLSGYVSLFGGRLSARCSYAEAYQSHSKRCRHPDRLTFQDSTFQDWRSGEVSIPARCRAARFQNPLPSRRRPLRMWRSLGDSNSVPSASEADALLQ
jgi:hypothetical protein